MGKGKDQENNINSKYELLNIINEGGNAKVMLAKDKETSETFALKRLVHFDEEKELRFRNEIAIMTGEAPSTPGVMPIVFFSSEHCWYTMPIGQSIKELLANKDEWPIKKIIESFIQLVATLEELHKKGISHRDIKPDNIVFYNSRFYFVDFGLVDFPEADSLTENGRGLGSTFTIAPEMKRYPKEADGIPADIYSMAKTLWMLLTGDDKGFDGQYNEDDEQHRLKNYPHLEGEHILEIEELLAKSTDTDPTRRPTAKEFKEKLEEWLYIHDNLDLSQKKDWEHLIDRLFNGCLPESVTYNKLEDIVRVLNELTTSSVYNHVFLPTGGGLDLKYAEIAAEEGCIALRLDLWWVILRPKALYFVSFEDVRWNYFLLETETLEPKVIINPFREEVVEDIPGHYVNGQDSCYGVYDYESGEKFPDGWRVVERIIKGNFLFVMKMGLYNRIRSTYDGRHSYYSPENFRTLIESYQNYLITRVQKAHEEQKDINERAILNSSFFEKSPCKDIEVELTDIPHLPSPIDFIKNNFNNWIFTIPEIPNNEGALAFYFVFRKSTYSSEDFFATKILILNNSGRIVEVDKNDLTSALIVRNRQIAIDIANYLNEQVRKFCDGYDTEHIISLFSVEWFRVRKPSHLFTKDEMLKLYQEADDRKGNRLVIDEEGYAQMISLESDGSLYPVHHEPFDPRKNYVGKYSAMPTLNYDYRESLKAWLIHLQDGGEVYCDGSLSVHEDEETLIQMINEITNVHQ